MRIWVTAMRCNAAFSCRLPDRVIRTRPAVSPDHTGIGRDTGVAGELASAVNRVIPADSPTIFAAVNAPHPGIASSVGRLLDQLSDPPSSPLIRAVKAISRRVRPAPARRRSRPAEQPGPQTPAGAWPGPATAVRAPAPGRARGPATASC